MSASKIPASSFVRFTVAYYDSCVQMGTCYNGLTSDRVLLKVSPWKKLLQFGRKRKLSPRIIWLYEIIKRISSMTYILVLPSSSKRFIIFPHFDATTVLDQIYLT
ncbi:Chromo domain-containing protein [Gossypium australe]|uniref:Chromo domain-containing protein n=1 Tax=Gossypium australe TaxID=47621 RepID=A0A5B6VW36_9ROSI|nr:Chromo domain-containing protein [Gossypium australe]